MHTKRFLLIGLFLLVLSTSSFFVFIYVLNFSSHLPAPRPETISFWYPTICSPPPGKTGGCAGDEQDPIIGKSTMSGLAIEYEWPKKIGIDGSDSVSVFLVAPANASISNQENVSGGTSIDPVSGASLPSNTDNRQIKLDEPFFWEAAHNCEGEDLQSLDPCTIDGAFGHKYEAFVSAHLVASAFDAQLIGPAEASVNQNSIEWNWNIQPKKVGRQVVNLDIEVRWKPVAGGEEILRQVWRQHIVVEADQPFLNEGQITLFSLASAVSGLLTGLAGIGITVSSVYVGVRKMMGMKKEEEKLVDTGKSVKEGVGKTTSAQAEPMEGEGESIAVKS